jgi:hypothetical protein
VSQWRSRAAAQPETQGGGAAWPGEGDDHEGGLGRSGLRRPIVQLGRSGACWTGVE